MPELTIGVFGPQGAGKTSIATRCCDGDSDLAVGSLSITIETAGLTIWFIVLSHNRRLAQHTLTIDGNTYSVEILDTGCPEIYEELRTPWIQQCRGLMLVYDTSSASSLGQIAQLLCAAKAILSTLYPLSLTVPAIPIALVGNKTDKARRALEK
jgi:GTPase SAR1 family protein